MPRSTHSGQAGTIRRSPGAASRIAATAAACSSSRGSTSMDLMSSAKPTMAMNSAAPKTASGIFSPAAPPQTTIAQDDQQRCRDHRDARALRRRDAVRRPRIRPRERVPQQHRPDCPGDGGRKHRCGGR